MRDMMLHALVRRFVRGVVVEWLGVVLLRLGHGVVVGRLGVVLLRLGHGVVVGRLGVVLLRLGHGVMVVFDGREAAGQAVTRRGMRLAIPMAL